MITLADELRGTPIRRLNVGVPVRREHIDAQDAKREKRLYAARLRAKKYRAANPARAREVQRLWRERNKARLAKLKDEWRKKNIARIRLYNAKKMRDWRREHLDEARARANAWAKAHRDQLNAKRRERYAKQRAAA